MNHVKNYRAVWLGFVAAVALTATCASAAGVRQQFDRSYPVAANVRVSLKNINGGVHISGWSRNEVQVKAIKHADSQEKLDRMQIDVQASNESVAIRTKLPKGTSNNPGQVEYEIHVPRGAKLEGVETVNGAMDISDVRGGVHGASVNGAVSGHELSGDVELRSVNGGVRLEVVDFANASNVKLSTVNGGVELRMPHDSNVHLTAKTVHGGISSDFSLPIQKGFVGSSLDTTLGSGNTHVDLSSVNGGVSIQRGAEGL